MDEIQMFLPTTASILPFLLQRQLRARSIPAVTLLAISFKCAMNCGIINAAVAAIYAAADAWQALTHSSGGTA